MTKCPKCGAELVRDEVDIGVGIQYGPAGCPDCHWVEQSAVVYTREEFERDRMGQTGDDLAERNKKIADVRDRSGPDVCCEHGVAMDVHCCGCHSGYIFDRDHVCEPLE